MSATAALCGPAAERGRASARAAWGVMLAFLVHGLVVSTWVSRLPSVKAALRLSDGALGLALLGTAIGSILGIAAAGVLVTRFGSRHAAQWSVLAFCAALVLPALARDGASLFLALLVYGAMAGANDVSMNAQAVGTERLLGRPVISRFHAMFSAGGILGAAAGGWIAGRGVAVPAHLALGAITFALVALASGRMTIETTARDTSAGPPRHGRMVFTPALAALSTIGFCIFLSEGAMADWTAVYLRQVLHASMALAPVGYAVFSAAMTLFRFTGDAITARLGRVRVVRYGGILAAAGVAAAVCAPTPGCALVGFAAAGAGYSSIIPLAFAAGGRKGPVSEGQGVATVSGTGYMGFLVGPPLIGFLSQAASLRAGLGLLVVLGVVAAALAGAVE